MSNIITYNSDVNAYEITNEPFRLQYLTLASPRSQKYTPYIYAFHDDDGNDRHINIYYHDMKYDTIKLSIHMTKHDLQSYIFTSKLKAEAKQAKHKDGRKMDACKILYELNGRNRCIRLNVSTIDGYLDATFVLKSKESKIWIEKYTISVNASYKNKNLVRVSKMNKPSDSQMIKVTNMYEHVASPKIVISEIDDYLSKGTGGIKCSIIHGNKRITYMKKPKFNRVLLENNYSEELYANIIIYASLKYFLAGINSEKFKSNWLLGRHHDDVINMIKESKYNVYMKVLLDKYNGYEKYFKYD